MKIKGSQTIYQDVEVHDNDILNAACQIILRSAGIPSGGYIVDGWLEYNDREPAVREATARDYEAFAACRTIERYKK